MFYDVFIELCNKKGVKPGRVAEECGINRSNVSLWKSRGYTPRGEALNKLAAYFGVSVDYLLGYEEKPVPSTIPPGFMPPPRTVKVPLVGTIACGTPITAEQNIEDYVDVPEGMHCDFCLRCKGDSMIDAGIHDGDVVYIRIQPEVESGQIAAVRIDGEATLKRAYWDEAGQTLTLIAANNAFAPLVYTGPALATVHIEGKAVGFTHWF